MGRFSLKCPGRFWWRTKGFHTEIGLPHVGTTFCCTPLFTARARAPCKLRSLLLCFCLRYGNFQFDYRYCRRSSCDCRLARLCAHSGSFFGYGPIVSTVGTNGLLYSRDFAYRVIARELALALMYKKPLVLLRPRGDGSPAATGAPPGSLSARCVSCLSPCVNNACFPSVSFNN